MPASLPNTDSPEGDSGYALARNISKRYQLAIGIIAVLSIAAQLLLQIYLNEVRFDSRAINLSGKMRMLSQRMVKQALVVQQHPLSTDYRDGLSDTIDEFELIFTSLQNGNESLGLIPTADRNLELFARASPILATSLDAARSIPGHDTSQTAVKAAVDLLVSNDDALLTAIAEIPARLDEEAASKIDNLRRFEISLLLLTLTTLVLEVFIIFRPMRRLAIETIETATRAGAENATLRGKAQAGAMAGRMIQEINSPVESISLVAKLITRQLIDTETVDSHVLAEQIDQINLDTQKLEHVSQLIKNLSSGDFPSKKEFVSPQLLYEDAKRLIKSDYGEESAALVKMIPPDHQMQISCYPLQLTQILVDLIENALDATQSMDSRWVEVLFLENQESVDIIVSDSGRGIEDELVGRIFDPFFTTRENLGHLGLGLSIARKFASVHGGRIYYLLRDGRTAFTISIPKEV